MPLLESGKLKKKKFLFFFCCSVQQNVYTTRDVVTFGFTCNDIYVWVRALIIDIYRMQCSYLYYNVQSLEENCKWNV